MLVPAASETSVATCPKLPSFQGGWFLPGVCNTGSIYPGDSCSIHCRLGYRKLQPIHSVTCEDDLRWSLDMTQDVLERICVKDYVEEIRQPSIICPNDGRLSLVLPPGHSSMAVRFPQPKTSVDFQKVKFTAVQANRTSSCTLSITVEDREAPQVSNCPRDIEKVLERGRRSQIVFWSEPNFLDNVQVAHVYKSREPGSEFVVGRHPISYIATDSSDNKAYCRFTIDVKESKALEMANSIRAQSYNAYADRRADTSEYYFKAVLVCPSGAQYEVESKIISLNPYGNISHLFSRIYLG
ncbi:hypothetical protein YQE_02104, partial [Dendroctonus ponderosae]